MHITNNSAGAVEMPRYKCHKEVWALKIKGFTKDEDINNPGGWIITPEDPRFAPFPVPREYVEKYGPSIGGYYVVYGDGYKSFSPADVFEAGYSLITQ